MTTRQPFAGTTGETEPQASQTAAEARQAASGVADEAKRQTADVAEQAKRQTRDLVSQTREQVVQQAAGQQERAASGVHDLADGLSRMADQVSTGDLDVPEVTVKGSDEVAVLSGSFNRMRISLTKALKMLEGE